MPEIKADEDWKAEAAALKKKLATENARYNDLGNLTGAEIRQLSTPDLLSFYETYNGRSETNIRQRHEKAVSRRIADSIDNLVGETDVSSLQPESRKSAATDVLKVLIQTWYETQDFGKIENLTEKQLDLYVSSTAQVSSFLSQQGYSSDFDGLVDYIADRESRLTDDDGTLLGFITRDLATTMARSGQQRSITRIRDQLSTNHQHYNDLLTRVNSLPDVSVTDAASQRNLLSELDTYLAKERSKEPKKSYEIQAQ